MGQGSPAFSADTVVVLRYLQGSPIEGTSRNSPVGEGTFRLAEITPPDEYAQMSFKRAIRESPLRVGGSRILHQPSQSASLTALPKGEP